MNEGYRKRRASLLGIPIDALAMEEVVDSCEEAIHQHRHLLLGVVNAAKVVNMRRDAELGRAVRAADMILADGVSVVWASRVLGRRVPERVTGIDLMLELLSRADRHGYRVYCLGATDDVLGMVIREIRSRYPGAHLVGWRNGYFRADEEAEVAAGIAAARPDMLFVAMGSPKKELFMARWADHMGVSVCHGVGGAFDVIAGKVKRAPARWQRLGLEWLYRIAQEPRRMWRRYLVTNTLFCGLVLMEMVGRIRPSRAGVS